MGQVSDGHRLWLLLQPSVLHSWEQPLPLVTPQVVGTPLSNNKPLMAISILHCITSFLRIAFSMQVRSFACIVRTEIWRLELHESLTHTTKNGLFTATITLHVTYRCQYTGLSVNWADRYMNRFFHCMYSQTPLQCYIIGCGMQQMEQTSFATSSFGEYTHLAPWVVMEVLGLCSYYCKN